MMRIESSWSVLPQAPNIIVPRQSLETWTPVRPRGRRSMSCSCSFAAPAGAGAVLSGAGTAFAANAGRVRRRRPAGEEVERLLRGRPSFRGEDRDAESVVGAELHRLVTQMQLADHRVVDALGAGAVEAHVVRCPAQAELVAAGGQLADEVGERPVVGIAAGLGAQVGDELRGDAVPLGVEVGGTRVEEREPGAVGRL